VQAEMDMSGSATDLVAAVNRVEASLQAAFPQARWVFFEPEVVRPHPSPPPQAGEGETS
jgi:hypothetical protein